MKKYILAAAALLTMGCVYKSPLPDQKQVIRPERLDVPRQAPNFRFKFADGRRGALEDLKGKFVLVNFFATWCKSCRYEFPTFSNLAGALNRDDFVVLGISLDEDIGAFKRFAEERKGLRVTFAHDAHLEGRNLFAIDTLPATFLIDPERNFVGFFDPIRKVHSRRVEGFETWDSKYLIEAFAKFLDEP